MYTGEEQRKYSKEKMKKASENCGATLMYQHMCSGIPEERRKKKEEKIFEEKWLKTCQIYWKTTYTSRKLKNIQVGYT